MSAESLSRESLRAIAHEVLSFCLVGGLGLVVDVSVFNLLRLTLFAPGAVHGGPVLAKLVSTTLAIAVNWVGNRFWTFREKRQEDVLREGVEFMLASLAGLVVSIACLWISHYLLGFRTVLDDNLSGNLVGLVLEPRCGSCSTARGSTAADRGRTGRSQRRKRSILACSWTTLA